MYMDLNKNLAPKRRTYFISQHKCKQSQNKIHLASDDKTVTNTISSGHLS